MDAASVASLRSGACIFYEFANKKTPARVRERCPLTTSTFCKNNKNHTTNTLNSYNTTGVSLSSLVAHASYVSRGGR